MRKLPLTCTCCGLVAHMCCGPNRATQCRARSVAPNSRNFRDVAGMSRYTPRKDRVAPVFPPLCRSCVRSVLERRTDVRLEGGGVALEVPEASQENILPTTDRATRGCRSYTHTNRATLRH